MRHLGSLLFALVGAAVAWILMAFGIAELGPTELNESASASDYALVVPLCCLGAAGLILGLLTSVRTSPLGAAVAGAVFTAYGICTFAVSNAPQLPKQWHLYRYDLELRLPALSGSAVVLGAVLLVSVISRRRWQRWPTVASAGATASSTLPSLDPFTSQTPVATTPEEPELSLTAPATTSVWSPQPTSPPAGSSQPALPQPALPPTGSSTETTEPNALGSSPWTGPPSPTNS